MPLSESRREKYAQNLYDAAESIKAKAILEVGLGWLISGHAFCESMANRPPGRLVSIEQDLTTPLPDHVVADFAARKVSWSVLRGDGMTLPVTGTFDLLYLDGPCSRDGIAMAWNNLAKNIRKGGLIIIDGYGDHMVRQGYPGISEFVEEGRKSGRKFTISEYIKDCAHAIAKV